MLDLFRSFFKPQVKSLNYIQISQANILHNIEVLQSYQKKSEIWPVVKSNAYGHGLKEISSILKKTKGKYLCVDSFPEYQIARKYSKKNILVLGETRNENYKYYDFSHTTFCVYTLEVVEFLISLKKKITIHLFLNTGMNREGFQQDQLEIVLQRLKHSSLIVEGVCSHFSSADESDFSTSQRQIDIFKKMSHTITQEGFTPKYNHIAASAGTLKLTDTFFNACRPGMSIYGVNVLGDEDMYYQRGNRLKLAMELYSTVIKKQKLEPGEGVSYNHTYITQDPTVIAVVPFGYYEGFDRKLSNNYSVKIHNSYYSMRGNICMNMSTIEVKNDQVRLGDPVQILSNKKEDQNTLYSFAQKTNTIPYEIVVKLQSNIHREVI